MFIELAKEEDLGKICEIHISCWQEVYHFIPDKVHKARTWKVRYLQWLRVLKEQKPGTALFVLKQNTGEVVGFCFCAPNEDCDLNAASELHAAYILPEFRGGITGPLMMSTMVKFLMERDLTPIGLWAFDENKIQRWYQMLGFKRSIRRDRVIENTYIPESGFVCLEPDKLLARLQPIIDRYAF